MTAQRRTRYNFGLDRAIGHARALGRPLVVLEALRVDYRWASDRLHRFVIEGMADNAAAFAGTPVAYLPYVEPSPGAGRGLLEALAADAAVVVTDHFPCFFLPKMVASAAARLDVRVEAIDGNGLMPLEETSGPFPTAHSFRRTLQKTLLPHLNVGPEAAPLQGLELPRARLSPEILRRWPAHDLSLDLSGLPIDHAVGPAPARGGQGAADAVLRRFLDQRLDLYGEGRNQPEPELASGLSPYLHFGHLSVHEVWAAVAAREGWRPEVVAPTATGSREGWWGLRPTVESFLDELVTWRELGYVYCHRRSDYADFRTLPDWALKTLDKHRADPRPRRYGLDALDAARTHDALWNAAQTQLVREGRIHNYLRMLWGKKVLEWSETPEAAFEALIHLNNRYAVDGRDPNSYSGIAWTFGRFDRPWGPERPIFGTVRYMSSDNTARKLDVKRYLELYEP